MFLSYLPIKQAPEKRYRDSFEPYRQRGVKGDLFKASISSHSDRAFFLHLQASKDAKQGITKYILKHYKSSTNFSDNLNK
ncbi:hypothetical protein HQ42_06665 [Porphyromonas gulae]|uniref:Uncharacterized protein n=1 Tax=Porphyromonas gulae TaxID=111105 RepID=A0A0A2FCU6_9PORP|nr:hypothetical protein HR15_05625 [Porphyromonas gulae]KGO02407.1 hypothetical protein HQ42_06665 [Porphyromonas gulae]